MPPTFMEKISRRFILLLVTLLSLVPARTQAQAAHAMDNPALAIGLSGVADWSTQNPFIDLMKTARPWIGHRPGQHGGMDFEALQAAAISIRKVGPLPCHAESKRLRHSF